MSNEQQREIIMRIPVDRPVTEADRRKMMGVELFQERLLKAGWVDNNRKVLKTFDVSFRGTEEDGNHFIEWKAVLRD